ncbi:MAG TPA: TonB-dependent receptor, partial [Candidatus Didemnitutus sp.]|nr:TonB-dependent receptor [Candidatus Didemnitutus sp.]
MNHQKLSLTLRVTAAALALVGAAGRALGQNTATTAAEAEKPKDVVTLPQFTVTESPANPYISKQALSGTRVAMNIQDIPQTVSVVTSDFMKDTMSQRMLDAAKYVTPVVESTLPVGGDRYTIRGFQVSHEFIDGMVISGEDGYSMSLAPYNIDRIEIIKGPNAILVPGGAPGGQFNPITKSPLMKNQQSVTLELAQYIGNAISTDLNYVLSQQKGVATRFVAAYWDSDGYTKNFFRKGWEFAPSISWQLSPSNLFIAKAEFVHNDESTAVSIPLDPAVGSDNYAVIARGLPKDWSFGNDQDHRVRETARITLELQSTLNDHITSRLMLSGDHILREDQGGSTASIFWPVNGVLTAFNPTRNPYTGKYEPGVTWTVDNSGPYAVATSTSTPIPDPSTWVFRRINGSDHLYYNEAHLRNDYAGKWANDVIDSTTVAGLAANFSKTKWKSWAGSSQGPDVPNTQAGLDGITYTPYNFTTLTQNKTAKLSEMQVYAYETAKFFKDMLQVVGGVSQYFGTLSRTDNTNIPAQGPDKTLDITSTAVSYGLLVRPIKPVTLYWSHNSSGDTMPGSLQAGNANLSESANPPYKPANGEQDEYGIKGSFFHDTLTFSLCHFDITQTNYPVPNSEYYVLVSQGNQAAANLLPTSTFLDVESKGWEAEASWAATKNLTVIANYSDYTYRQPTGVRIRAVPDTIWAAFADYHFTDGALRGFGINLSVDSKSDMVGESVTALTTTKPLQGVTTTYPGVAPGFVPQVASYKYDGRTLLNLGLYYKAKNWTARVQVNNLTDEDYIAVGGSRTAIGVGVPREWRASFNYTF